MEPEHLILAKNALGAVSRGAEDWLSPGEAVDIPFEGPDSEVTENFVRESLAGAPVDVFVQSIIARRKRLLVADMDSTMIAQESLDELADAMGLRDKISAITERAMRGDLDFAAALRERVAMLKGLPVFVLEETLDRLTETAGAATLVKTMRAHGARCVLVSGGFDVFTGPVARRMGFDAHFGNRLGVANGELDGTVADPILDKNTKRDIVRREAEGLKILLEEVLVVGDGANDLLMIQEAGAGVAFHGKPKVHDAARYKINSADLSALLYLQGYRVSEFQT